MVTQRAVGSVESSVHPAKLSEGKWVVEEAEDGCERRVVGARDVNVNLSAVGVITSNRQAAGAIM